MKRNLLIVPALMVTAFFATTEIAKAADISFSGEILTRLEVNEHGLNNAHTFNDDSDSEDFVVSRVRLNADVAVNDTTSAFIQMSRNATWGANAVDSNNTGNATGAANGSFQVSDEDNNLGLHQAYFTLKNFASLPADMKVGRQQIVLDGHRLFGNTIWTVGQQTHDAVRLDHKHDNMSFSYAYIVASEGGTPGNNATVNTDSDVAAHMGYFKYAGILGGNLSLTYAGIIDPCGTNGATCTTNPAAGDNDQHTIGARQAGQLYGIDYRGEYYYQWGDANQDAQNLTTGASTAGVGVERDAYMFGVRIGKTFKNVTMKPGLTIWYDYLSGTDDDDLTNTNAKWKSFNPVFDTGHKFYGLQDLFLGVGTGSESSGTAALGLQDLAIKTKMSPAPGWTLKADYHWFYTAASAASNMTRGVSGKGTNQTTDVGIKETSVTNELGNEIDITLVNKYNANTTITAGFSNYSTTQLFRELRNVDGGGANWAYLQFHVKF
jgi:hypothetical protein